MKISELFYAKVILVEEQQRYILTGEAIKRVHNIPRGISPKGNAIG